MAYRHRYVIDIFKYVIKLDVILYLKYLTSLSSSM